MLCWSSKVSIPNSNHVTASSLHRMFNLNLHIIVSLIANFVSTFYCFCYALLFSWLYYIFVSFVSTICIRYFVVGNINDYLVIYEPYSTPVDDATLPATPWGSRVGWLFFWPLGGLAPRYLREI